MAYKPNQNKTCSYKNCEREVFEFSDKCIRHCEKDSWYDEIILFDEKRKDWTKSAKRVNAFWEEIRNFIKTEHESDKINFQCIIFPIFVDSELSINNNFKTSIEKLIFNKEIDFQDSIFLGIVSFKDTTFQEKVYFQGSIFKDKVHFFKTTFQKEVFLDILLIMMMSYSLNQPLKIKQVLIIQNIKKSLFY